MRTIKFRGKSICEGRWIFGDLFRTDLDGDVSIQVYDEEDGWMTAIVRPETVGQFTGFLDFYRKEIYEGDIIQRYYKIGDGKIYKFEGVVVFEDGAFGVKQGDSMLHLHSVKGWSIIGNIFDNPELMKGGEK